MASRNGNAYGITDMPARTIVSDNLQTLMDWKPSLGSTLAIERATERHGCKVGKSTVDRMKHGTTPVNLDYLEAIAAVFGFDCWQLLVPGMDPRNPPTLRSIGQAEENIYRRMADLAAQVADLSKPGKHLIE